MSGSRAHKINSDLLRKGGRKITQRGKSYSPAGKGTLTHVSYFYGPTVGRFVAKKQNRIVEPQNIILFRVDKSLDDAFLQSNLSPKEVEAKKIFANYRRGNS